MHGSPTVPNGKPGRPSLFLNWFICQIHCTNQIPTINVSKMAVARSNKRSIVVITMAKRPSLGKCVHCLQDPVERNWDHIFPKSWYPDTTPAELDKWKVPSCVGCNSTLGAIENDFLVRVALSLDPNSPASRSIVQKAFRAMNPNASKTPSDRTARTALARRTSADMLHGLEIPAAGAYPTLGNKWGLLPSDGMAIKIPAMYFRRITEKIVRGFTYFHSARFIEPPYKVDFYALDDLSSKPIRKMLDAHGTTHARAPGLTIRRGVAVEDGISAFYELEFWEQFKTHASVLDDD